jgi:long-chain acyl-CoA synthetase
VTFLEHIFRRLETDAQMPLLREVRDGQFISVTGSELLNLVNRARQFLATRGLNKGDRCALIAPNSIRWVALDLALMAEGIIAVPLYSRQAAQELIGMLKDSTPAVVICPDQELAGKIGAGWSAGPRATSLDDVFGQEATHATRPHQHADSDAVAIIYTSGTSGEPKGVILNAANIDCVLRCASARLDRLMEGARDPDQVFHYTPFCFAASWIATLTFLSRHSVLTLSTDLSKLSDELKLASPDYFLNVPTLLERVRAKICESIQNKGGLSRGIFSRAQRAFLDGQNGDSRLVDRVCLLATRIAIFPKIRKNIGPNLKAFICGSAPLAVETQLFFMMLGIPVLQVYGLTETTAICTMDDPREFEPGRVGQPIPGVEMRIADSGEILVRGPNIFSGYWLRPDETSRALSQGWFHTGDQGEVNERGNWKVTGRLKNLLVLNSGHKVAPEPLEQQLARYVPEAQQLLVLGDRRSYLTLLVAATGANGLCRERIQPAIDSVNAGLPHYKQIRGFHVVDEPFSIESGLLTANGKPKRDAICARYSAEIERLYQKQTA